MKCQELQSDLMLYADGFLAEREHVLVKGHLEVCPLCRQKYADIREIKASMRQMSRPVISTALQMQLKQSVRSDIRESNKAWFPIQTDVRLWMQTRLMPYALGLLASLVMGFTLMTMMFSGLRNTNPDSAAFQSSYRSDKTLLASNSNPFRESENGISATDYANTRLDISSESPSVNPQGAVIALTKSFVRGGMKDDEVVVVADVFGNGLAKISEVIEPSRDTRAVSKLQKALSSDPAYAAFVPASLDKRSDNVRVVLRFQSVNVSTGVKRHKL